MHLSGAGKSESASGIVQMRRLRQMGRSEALPCPTWNLPLESPSASPFTLWGEADVNMLIQPCLVLFQPKLQYASDLRILDFSLRKEINDLSGE